MCLQHIAHVNVLSWFCFGGGGVFKLVLLGVGFCLFMVLFSFFFLIYSVIDQNFYLCSVC